MLPRKEPEAPPEFHFEIEATPKQQLALLDLIRTRIKGAGPSQAAFFKHLETIVLGARRMNTPLIREYLDWPSVRRLAREQGITEADALWDLMGKKSVRTSREDG